jgi:hypothetical protein
MSELEVLVGENCPICKGYLTRLALDGIKPKTVSLDTPLGKQIEKEFHIHKVPAIQIVRYEADGKRTVLRTSIGEFSPRWLNAALKKYT